jgi:hypothetical protein
VYRLHELFNDIIHTVAKGLGMSVEGSIDKHSVARITLEGGVGAEMQLVHEIHNATTDISPLSVG